MTSVLLTHPFNSGVPGVPGIPCSVHIQMYIRPQEPNVSYDCRYYVHAHSLQPCWGQCVCQHTISCMHSIQGAMGRLCIRAGLQRGDYSIHLELWANICSQCCGCVNVLLVLTISSCFENAGPLHAYLSHIMRLFLCEL